MPIGPGEFERGFLARARRASVVAGEQDREDDGAPPQIAVHGKALRRSFDRRRGRTPRRPVSAFATRSGPVPAQRRTPDKGGEPAVRPDLLAGLALRGAPASLDAASCHPGVAAAIAGRGGDDPIAREGNRRALHAAVRGWFDARALSVGGGLRPCPDSWDDEHGRLVRRRVFVAGAADLVAAWPGLRRMAAVGAIRSVGNLRAGRAAGRALPDPLPPDAPGCARTARRRRGASSSERQEPAPSGARHGHRPRTPRA
jgi:hypothetical protein